ncbi:hypothetical protein D3C84_622860 [compost metagenome]
MLLLRAMDGVVRDDQAMGAVVGVDAVDDVVAVGVALDHEVPGLIAVEAVPHVRELGTDDPAGRFRALEHLGHVGRVLGNTHPVGLTVGVAEAGHLAVDDVRLGATPGQQERAELLGRAEARRAVFLLAPAGDFRVAHEQLAVVDQERTGLFGQAQLLGLLVDVEDALGSDHDRQPGQEHARCRFAEVLFGQCLGQVLEVQVAVVDKDRLGDAVLTHHPFGHLVIAADEVLQRVFLHHPPHADLAGLAAYDLCLDRLRGVAGQVGQGRRRQFQWRGRCAADGVGLGLLQFLGHGHRFAFLGRRGRFDAGKRCVTGQQQRSSQQAERTVGRWDVHPGHSLGGLHQKCQITSTNARCMYESTWLP